MFIPVRYIEQGVEYAELKKGAYIIFIQAYFTVDADSNIEPALSSYQQYISHIMSCSTIASYVCLRIIFQETKDFHRRNTTFRFIRSPEDFHIIGTQQVRSI